jgi:putative isomerase
MGAVNNFFDRQASDGSIPILITDKDADCFDTADPTNNMAKPVFGQFCELIAANSADSMEQPSLFKPWLNSLKRFYDCYESRYENADTGLYVWANDVAIGVDDDPATWGRPPFSSANIFLNCFMRADLRAAAKFAERLTGEVSFAAELAGEWNAKAAKLADAVNEYCWDERDAIYYSVDVQSRQNLMEHRIFGELNVNLKPFWKVMPLKVMSWSSFLPMWSGIASKERAGRMVNEHLLNDKRFLCDYGVRTLSADERMYSPSESRGNPSNWLGPVWIISNYLVWKGLERVGFAEAAAIIAARTSSLLEQDLEKNGFLHENYDPETGEGMAAPGFWNWNILAVLMS